MTGSLSRGYGGPAFASPRLCPRCRRGSPQSRRRYGNMPRRRRRAVMGSSRRGGRIRAAAKGLRWRRSRRAALDNHRLCRPKSTKNRTFVHWTRRHPHQMRIVPAQAALRGSRRQAALAEGPQLRPRARPSQAPGSGVARPVARPNRMPGLRHKPALPRGSDAAVVSIMV